MRAGVFGERRRRPGAGAAAVEMAKADLRGVNFRHIEGVLALAEGDNGRGGPIPI